MLIAEIQHKIRSVLLQSSDGAKPERPSVVVNTQLLHSEDSWGMDRVNAEVA